MRVRAHRDYWLCPCHTRSKDRGLRHRPPTVLAQQIVARLDHKGLDGSCPVQGELPQRLQSFWIDPRQDTPRCRARVRRRMRSQPRPTRSRTRGQRTHRTDAGHDLALGQMPVAHQPLATIGQLISMHAKQGCNLASVTRSIRMRFSIHTASRNGNCSYGGLTLTLVHFRALLRQPWRTRLGPISRRPAASARSAVASCARNAPRSA